MAIGVVTPISALGFHREKRVNSLAVTSPKRLASLPDVPTVAEALGVAEYDSQTWFALAGPANMPRQAIERLSQAIRQIMQDQDMLNRFANMGLVPAEDNVAGGTGSSHAIVQRAKWRADRRCQAQA